MVEHFPNKVPKSKLQFPTSNHVGKSNNRKEILKEKDPRI